MIEKIRKLLKEYKEVWIYFKNNPKETLTNIVPWMTFALALLICMSPIIGIKKIIDRRRRKNAR